MDFGEGIAVRIDVGLQAIAVDTADGELDEDDDDDDDDEDDSVGGVVCFIDGGEIDVLGVGDDCCCSIFGITGNGFVIVACIGFDRVVTVVTVVSLLLILDGGDGSNFTFLNRVLADRVASGCLTSGSGLIFMVTSIRFGMFASQHGTCTFFVGTLIISSSVT